MFLKEVSEAQNTQEKDEELEKEKGQKELKVGSVLWGKVPGECEAVPDLVETFV